MIEEIINLEIKRLDLIKNFIKIQSKYFELTKEYQTKIQSLYIELIKTQGKLGLMKHYKDNNQVLPTSTFEMIAGSQDEDIEKKMTTFIEMFNKAQDEFISLEENEHETIEAKEYLQLILKKIYFNKEYNDLMQIALSSYVVSDLHELKNIYFDIPPLFDTDASYSEYEETKERLLKEIRFLEDNYPEREEEVLNNSLLLEQEKDHLQLQVNEIQRLIDEAYDMLDDYESAGQA